MHVHLVGVAGTGMGALAGLFREAGHRVTGSDVAFHPPMGPALRAWGVETMEGYDASHLVPAPDLVVIGNVCRKDNPEARAAIDGGLVYDSMPGAIERLFLAERPGFVVAGTHGKTTTTSLLAHLLHEGGADPGLLVGGIPKNFDRSYRIGGPKAPFVLEGDEYDSAFFEKTPKFLRYKPFATIITSIEHDHVDIYPDEASYIAAFDSLVARIPEDGLLVAWAGCARVRAVASRARCRVRYYALDRDDTGGIVPDWLAAPAPYVAGAMPFDLFGGGSSMGRVYAPMSGHHNVRNALAAIALATEGASLDLDAMLRALRTFGGVRRRQEWLGTVHGVHVYEDFAHHPTAVRETLAGLRERHPDGRILAAFEPRSATASRAMHQEEYVHAFDAADLAGLAPVGRPEIAKDERLDVDAIARAVVARGREAFAAPSITALADRLVAEARPGDAIVLMSNGPFGGIYDDVLHKLLLRK
jgi:UDP-N-acetylmuramate: L-alanyl-gamma-D-glutamyl-meso-diaminopimelate ligase